MPSGKTHDRITLWCLPWVGGLTFLVTRNAQTTLIITAAFLFSGLMFGPDLDIHSIQFKRWGWLRWLWLPYQKVLRHRSGFSHGPLIGTTLRIIYLLLVLFLLAVFFMALAQLIWDFDWNWREFWQLSLQEIKKHQAEAIALFLGLELGAMSHSLSDWFGSTYKKFRRRGWKIFLPNGKKRRRRKSSRRRNKKS